jgi:predicted  nucleic acid-binding Zn-ribbon protein
MKLFFFNNQRAIALTLSTVLIASSVWLIEVDRTNRRLTDMFAREKLKADSLKAEKLSLQKELDSFKNEVADLSVKNRESSKSLQEASSKLAAMEEAMKKNRKENVSFQQLKKQHMELIQLRTDLEDQVTALKTSNARLQQENSTLTNRIAFLTENNKFLSEELVKAQQASTDNTQVEAVTRSGKLIVKAHRTRKIIMNFSVRKDLNNPSFKIIDPKGNTLTDKEGIFTSLKLNDNYVPGKEGSTQITRMEVTYKPIKKLKPGIYKIEVLNNNLHVGNFVLALR